MIKKVVFDLDNTLMDWKDEYIFALKKSLEYFNKNYDDKKIEEIDTALTEFEKYNTKYTNEIFLDYINKRCNTDLPLEFVDKLIEEQCECYEEFKGEKLDTIKYLSEKYELICLTNWFTYTQAKRLENAGISKYFKIITGGDEHELKPSLNAFNIINNPEECIMIGDNLEYDILPALKLGMKAILKTNKTVADDPRYKVIKNIEELKEIL